MLAAASVMGLKVQILKASTDREIDAAFVSLVQARTGALLVGNDLFFNSRIEQLVALAARHAIPTMYPFREFVVAGGLIELRKQPDRDITDRSDSTRVAFSRVKSPPTCRSYRPRNSS